MSKRCKYLVLMWVFYFAAIATCITFGISINTSNNGMLASSILLFILFIITAVGFGVRVGELK